MVRIQNLKILEALQSWSLAIKKSSSLSVDDHSNP